MEGLRALSVRGEVELSGELRECWERARWGLTRVARVCSARRCCSRTSARRCGV